MSIPYRGTDSLPQEVKERVLSTFRQTLATYRSGHVADAIGGCELLLKMDPLFDPAKKLLAKAKNPSLDVDLDALIPTAELDAEQLQEARRAFADRDFQRASAICTSILASDFTNEEAQRIASEAQEKLEAEPFIQQFLDKSRSELLAGNVPAARLALDKARSLDATHPAIGEHQAAIEAAVARPAGSSSFVVDAERQRPADPGRSRVEPAHDFGFTFEEDQPSRDAFSFDAGTTGFSGFGSDTYSGSTPVDTGDAHTFDFATASVEISPEDEAKIRQYMADGDRAAQGGDYQAAIDLWSRVFLIDVTNEEASQKIDAAKKKKLAADEAVEGALLAADVALDNRDYAGARAKFEEALRLDPGNAAARDGLNRVEGAAKSGPPAGEPTAPPLDMFDDFALPPPSAAAPPLATPLAPSAGSWAPAAQPKPGPVRVERPSAPRQSLKLPGINPMILIALISVAVLAAGGYYGYSRWSARKAARAAEQSQATLSQAQALARSGKYDEAITLLVGIQADDPEHDRALEMIADLKRKKAESAGMVGGRPATVVFAEYLEKARAAYAAHDYLAAKQAFEAAAGIRALPQDIRPLYQESTQQVEKLNAAINLFKEGKYADALTNLEPLRQADPENRNVAQLIGNAHFNLGVTALREERVDEAIKELDTVLQMDPADETAKRSREIAIRYKDSPKDLLYKIYVKYLPMR